MLAEGNPSRVRSLNAVGLKRAGFSTEDLSILKKAFRILYRSNDRLETRLEQLELLPDNPHLQHLQQFIRLSCTPQRRGLIPGKQRSAKDET
jgi:UDP-N-acetylglucosamine acyltransferase